MTRAHSERGGSQSISTVLMIPAVVLFLGVIVACGRIAQAHQSTDTAAGAAARAATIERTPGAAKRSAAAVAHSTLTNHGLECNAQVSTNTAGFATSVGAPANVTVTVTCPLALADLAVPGLPGTMTITKSATSPLDTYRAR